MEELLKGSLIIGILLYQGMGGFEELEEGGREALEYVVDLSVEFVRPEKRSPSLKYGMRNL